MFPSQNLINLDLERILSYIRTKYFNVLLVFVFFQIMKITLGRQDMLSFSLIFSLFILVKYFGFFKEGRKKGGGSGCITGYGMLIWIHSVPLRV